MSAQRAFVPKPYPKPYAVTNISTTSDSYAHSSVPVLKVYEQPTILIKKLHKKAILPTVGHPGEDIGYDVYALVDMYLFSGQVMRVPTGIAIELAGHGFLMRERSSLALKGITLSGGVIDAGYRGEIFANLTFRPPDNSIDTPNVYEISAGEKIAQLIPVPVRTHFPVIETVELSGSSRGEAGYGSTGL